VRLFIHECLSAGGLGPDAPASLRREGWAMLCAAAGDFGSVPDVRVSTLLDERSSDVPGCECRRIAVGEEPDAFRDFAACADATLVIAPEFCDLLLERSRWVLDGGGPLLGCSPEAIRLTGDKAALATHWHEHGVQTPATIPAAPAPPTAFGSPWVCKPRCGAGSQATFLVRDPEEWPVAFGRARVEWRAGELLAQVYAPGVAASMAFLRGPGQCIPLLPGAQNLTEDGRFQYRGGSVPLPTALRERAVRLAIAALQGIEGLRGYVGVDLVLGQADDGSDDHAIEINPRLTTSYIGLRRLCRDNLAQAWLDALRGQAVTLAWDERVIEFGADGSVV
jgi:predicted ATP-grasp superfamily ATP-dependent carboligase